MSKERWVENEVPLIDSEKFIQKMEELGMQIDVVPVKNFTIVLTDNDVAQIEQSRTVGRHKPDVTPALLKGLIMLEAQKVRDDEAMLLGGRITVSGETEMFNADFVNEIGAMESWHNLLKVLDEKDDCPTFTENDKSFIQTWIFFDLKMTGLVGELGIAELQERKWKNFTIAEAMQALSDSEETKHLADMVWDRFLVKVAQEMAGLSFKCNSINEVIEEISTVPKLKEWGSG